MKYIISSLILLFQLLLELVDEGNNEKFIFFILINYKKAKLQNKTIDFNTMQ